MDLQRSGIRRVRRERQKKVRGNFLPRTVHILIELWRPTTKRWAALV